MARPRRPSTARAPRTRRSTSRGKQGFASMSLRKRRAIARKGGMASHGGGRPKGR